MNNQHPNTAIKVLAKMGYASRGVIYAMVGGLALLTAFGQGGKTTDSKGALIEIYRQPLGEVLLSIIALGLVGYSLWRIIQGVGDTDNHGKSAKGLVVRGGLVVSAVTHAILAWWAVSFILGDGNNQSSSGDSKQWLEGTLGQVILVVTAAAFFGAGIAHLYKGYASKFKKYMDIPKEGSQWIVKICQFGLIARGVVWCLIAFFMFQSAMKARSGEISGITDALEMLRASPFGTYLFIIVASGLAAFGVYSLLESKYRNINPNQSSIAP